MYSFVVPVKCSFSITFLSAVIGAMYLNTKYDANSSLYDKKLHNALYMLERISSHSYRSSTWVRVGTCFFCITVRS